jgi:gliding motility-associated-like protein
LSSRKHIVVLAMLMLVLHAARMHAQAPGWAWARDVHTTASELAHDVAVDTVAGEAVVVGEFVGDISAYYGSNFAGAIGGGFVAKYDAGGNVLWAFPIGNNQDDACLGVVVSPNRNVYVTGYFQATADFKGTLSTSTILSSAGGKDFFLAKYNSAGQLLWARRGGGAGDDEGYAVCTNFTDIFVTGYFTGSGSFSGIPTVSNKANENLFVASYDPLGAIQWLTDAGSGQSTFGRDIIADNNGVYVTGDFKGTPLEVYSNTGTNVATVVNSNASSEDAFVMSLQTNGPFNWIRGIRSSNRDFGRGIAQNNLGIYVTGAISSSATFPSYTGNPVNTTANGLDMFVAQLAKSNGNANWVISEPGSADEEGLSICPDTNNLLAVTGYFEAALAFGGGPTLNSFGNEDVFVAGYAPGGQFQWATSAGDGGTDISYGIGAHTNGELYIAGEYANAAKFGSQFLTPDSPKNIFAAKLGCAPISTNTISAAQTICAGQVPAQLSGSLPSGGSSPYTYLWQSSPNGTAWNGAAGTNNAQNYTPPALSSTTYFRRIVASLSGCLVSDTSTMIQIAVDQPPDAANAGADSGICASSLNLYAAAPTVGTGAWTLVSGSGTVVAPFSASTSVTGLGTGVNVFAWTTSNGVCPSSVDSVKITVSAPPSPANAGANQTLCVSTYTLTAAPPGTGTGTWNVLTGSATVVSPGSASSQVNSLGAGANVFVWTVTNGSCAASSDSVTLWVDANPTGANAGSAQSICNDSVLLSGNQPAIGSGAWSIVSGGGALSSVTQATTTAYNLTAGTHVFMWSISNGVCPPSTSTVAITVQAPPSPANAGNDQTLCANTTVLAANVPGVGNGSWNILGGGAMLNNASISNPAVSGMTTGANTFEWVITNGACPPSRDTVVIYVTAPPSQANAGAAQSICGTTTNLNAALPGSGTGSWNVISGGGAVVTPSSNTSAVTSLTAGVNAFEWVVSSGVCAPSRDTVYITVDVMPSAANAGADQAVCSSASTLSGNTPTVGTGLWTTTGGPGFVNFPGAANSGVSGLGAGANVFVWSITNGSCPSSSDTVVITVVQPAAPANAGADQGICISSPSVTLAGSSPGAGTGSWVLFAGSGAINNPSQSNTFVTGLSAGLNSFVWTVNSGVCGSSSDTVVITVDVLPSAASAGMDFTVSAGSAGLGATAPVTGTGTWSVVSGTGIFSSASDPLATVSGLGIGDNVFGWTISNGVCPASYDEVIVHVNDLAIPNGFSPNADNVNDYFEIPGILLFSKVSLEVFNRWGNLVFESGDYKNDWGGKNLAGENLSDDTYYFTLKVSELKTYSGFVILKRK